MSARYDFGVRDDVDCLVTSVVAENPALRVIGESQGFDAVMQTILVAGCLYLRSREGITPDPDAPVWEIAKAARLLGIHTIQIELTRRFKCLGNGRLGNLVKHHALKAAVITANYFAKMPRNGLPFAIQVGREVDGVSFFS